MAIFVVLLTLSPRAEGASRDLVTELAALLGTELLALVRSKQPLVFVHVILVLLGADDVGKETLVVVQAVVRGILAVGPDLGNNTGNGLLSAGVAKRAGDLPAGLAVGGHALVLLLLLHRLLLLLVRDLLRALLLCLSLSLCDGGLLCLLLMHARPDSDVGDLLV